jgi:hypothetical protein
MKGQEELYNNGQRINRNNIKDTFRKRIDEYREDYIHETKTTDIGELTILWKFCNYIKENL